MSSNFPSLAGAVVSLIPLVVFGPWGGGAATLDALGPEVHPSNERTQSRLRRLQGAGP